MSKEETLLSQLTRELREDPDGAIELLSSMTNVVRPWEIITGETQGAVSPYKRMTVMGKEVASFQSGAPTWILMIEGEKLHGKRIFNARGAKEECMAALDAELSDRGYILMEPSS